MNAASTPYFIELLEYLYDNLCKHLNELQTLDGRVSDAMIEQASMICSMIIHGKPSKHISNAIYDFTVLGREICENDAFGATWAFIHAINVYLAG